MQTGKFNLWRGTFELLLMLAGFSFSGVSLSSAATNSPPKQPLPMNVARLRFSAGIGDIVRMVKANVEPTVIMTFIELSPVSYHPSAQEIIALKKLGVSNEIVVALLGHRPRASQGSQSSARPHPMMRAPEPDTMPRFVRPLVGAVYAPPYAYPVRTFAAFGSLNSFNNSYPTFVNGQAVYTGYYLPSYPVLW